MTIPETIKGNLTEARRLAHVAAQLTADAANLLKHADALASTLEGKEAEDIATFRAELDKPAKS